MAEAAQLSLRGVEVQPHPFNDDDELCLELAVALVRLVISEHVFELSMVTVTHMQCALSRVNTALERHDKENIEEAIRGIAIVRRALEEGSK